MLLLPNTNTLFSKVLVPFLVTMSMLAPLKFPMLASKGVSLSDSAFIAPNPMGWVFERLPGVPLACEPAAPLAGSWNPMMSLVATPSMLRLLNRWLAPPNEFRLFSGLDLVSSCILRSMTGTSSMRSSLTEYSLPISVDLEDEMVTSSSSTVDRTRLIFFSVSRPNCIGTVSYTHLTLPTKA